tara:strand:+ start:400 stop:684 length:285 start_codon:yes stop_codon:yes gene_type:complete
MKMALERYVEKLEINKIGKLSRLDEAVIGVTIGSDHDGKPKRFIYDLEKIMEEIIAETTEDYPEEEMAKFLTHLILQTHEKAGESAPVFVVTIQ